MLVFLVGFVNPAYGGVNQWLVKQFSWKFIIYRKFKKIKTTHRVS